MKLPASLIFQRVRPDVRYRLHGSGRIGHALRGTQPQPVLVALLLAMLAGPAAFAAPFIVNSQVDAVDAVIDGTCETAPGNGICTLRAAIQEANAFGDADTISVPPGMYQLAIPGNENAAAAADLDLVNPVTINGAGPGVTIVDGGALERVFEVLPGAVVSMTGLTVQNGNPAGVDGGGIYNAGSLTLTTVIITANLNARNGGGIHSTSTATLLSLTDVTVNGNTADHGAGIYTIVMTGPLTLTDVTLDGNTAGTEGGGMRVQDPVGAVTMTRVTVSGNSADKGGGLHFKGTGTADLENVTVSGNSVTGEGGGVRNEGHTLSYLNVTLTANTAPATKGAGHQERSGTTTFKNTIIADNTGGNCKDTPVSGGYNLDSDGSCALGGTGDISGQSPNLGPLANNGGLTQTHALPVGSIAIDAGTNTGCPGADQRGVGRPFDGDGDTIAVCDMGAFESDVVPTAVSGTILEDVNGDSLLGDALGVSGVTVRLYTDANDNGQVDTGDVFVQERTSKAGGGYVFPVDTGVTGDRYLVAVDSKTVPPNGASPFNAGFGQGDVWAEQTYGDDPATPAIDLGSRVGGIAAGTSDDFNSGDTSPASNAYQHLARVDLGGGSVSSVDFAFSFQSVSHTGDVDDDVTENRTSQGSLRQLVQNANAITGTPTVDLPAETYTLALTGNEDAALTGDLDVTESLTMTGAGAASTVIDAAGIHRVFDLFSPAILTASDLTITGGDRTGQVGGGIQSTGDLRLTDVVVDANQADSGSGIYTVSPGALTLTRVTIRGNSGDTNGGGLYIAGVDGSITDSTLSGNQSGKGGAIFHKGGVLTLTNVTISGNTATGEGGGIQCDDGSSSVTLTNVTVTNNTSSTGAGVRHRNGTLTLKNTLVADNITGTDCAGTITSSGYNLDGDGSCSLGGVGDVSSGNADLDVLGDNGGSTETHALLPASDAIDAVLAGCPPPAADQRGQARPSGAACDMGAFELSGPPAYAISGRIFEDADFAGTATDWDGGTSDVGLPNVDVELYDVTDTHVRSRTTDASGNFTIYAPDGTYKLRVRSATLGDDPGGPDETAPRGGFNACVAATCAEPLPEMTWANGSALYGGQDPEIDDTLTADNAGPGDTYVSITVDGAAISDVNFGFAYNLIVNTDDDSNAVTSRSKQGSLRQFIKNANAIGSAGSTTASSSEFRIPTTDDGYDSGSGVYTVSLSTALPQLSDGDTTLDATTQTSNVGDSNPGVVGTGGTVGVDEITLPQYQRPELAIDANGADGFQIGGAASSILIKGIAIYGADDGVDVFNGSGTNRTIDSLLIGTLPDGSDPGAQRNTRKGVSIRNGGQIKVTRCFIGWSAFDGIEAENDDSQFEITYSEVFSSGWNCVGCDGIDLNGASNIARYNLLRDTTASDGLPRKGGGNGIECGSQSAGTGNHIIENNTIRDNLSAGVNIRNGSTGVTVDRNISYGNEVGIAVDEESSGQTNHNTITRNSIYQNNLLGIDLHAGGAASPYDGVTLNDANDSDSGSNDLFNYPILETAQILGPNLTIEGWARPGTLIELFVANEDPTGFGEGQTHVITLTEGGTGSGGDDPHADQDGSSSLYGPGAINGRAQGTDTTNRYRFTMPTPAGVADGTKLTATGTDGSGNTSEFSGIVTTVELIAISGKVFEDTVGDLLADGPIGGANNPGLQSANVSLYIDDGTTLGEPDAGDTLVSGPTATDSSGDYVFTVASDDTYWVVVDSQTIVPDAGLNPSWAASDLWAEQTYGPEGAVAYDGSFTYLGAAGAFYGGKRATVSDNASGGLTSAEHVARVQISGASVADVDFGFSFNVVTNVAAPGSSQICCRSVQGSFDQFLQNSSVVAGANTMRFVPVVSTNASGGGGSWWKIEHTLPVGSRFQYYDFDTIIDGTAHDSSDGVTVLDPNPGYLGLNAAGGVTVGADGVALPQVAKPELEVFGRGFSPSFKSSAGTRADRSIIRNISAWGAANILSANGAVVPAVTLLSLRYENNVIGTPPDSFSDPGAGANDASCITFSQASSGQIINNLIGFCDRSLISASTSAGWTISGNELRDGGVLGAPEDAVRLGRTGGTVAATGFTVEANHIEGHPSNGIDSAQGGGHTIRNNTITGNGSGGAEIAGIRLATDANLVDRNVIQANTGPGVLIIGTDAGFAESPARQNKITANHFSGNGGPGIDLVAQGGDPALGDGPTANTQVPPNCGYDNNGGNRLIDAPIIDTADLVGPTTTVTGRACASSTVELYRASGDEGDLFLGSAATDGSGNFSKGVTGLTPADSVVAIVRDGADETSEFGGALALTEIVSISGTVFEDLVGDVLGDGVVGDANNPGLASVDVYLYDDTNGNGAPDIGEPLTAGVTNPATTNGSGAYAFSPLPAGNYLVVVDSRTIDPTQAFVASPVHWAEQTYGPAGSLCADWVAGTVARATAGPCYGGRRGAIFDDHASGVENAEHVVAVTVAGSSTGNDLGFSFNVVTNLDGNRDGLFSVYTGQGTLDMVMRNADAIQVPNTVRFVPAVPTNMTGAVFGGEWWRIDVESFSSLFGLRDADTVVDGTAFDYTDGVTVLDTNPGFMGTGAPGGVTVGLDAATLPQVARPELEIRGGFTIWSGATDSIIQDLAMTRGIDLISFITAVDGVRVRRNVLGAEPDDFVSPPTTATNCLEIEQATNGFVEDNLIGFCNDGIAFGTITKSATGWQVTGNELRGNGRGVSLWLNSNGNTIADNLFAANYQNVFDRAGGNTLDNLTITGSGDHGVILAGSSTTLTRSIIEQSTLSGVLIMGDETASANFPNSPGRNNRVTDNRFGGNETIAIDLAASGTVTAGDGVTPNDGGTDGTHGHNKLDHPVIASASMSGPTADISGTACPSCTVEIYRAVADGDGSDTYLGVDYGEGIELVATTAADGTGSFSVTGVTGLTGGDYVSAIALTTAAGPADTSEFGPNVLVTAPGKITGSVYHDANGSGALDPGESGIGTVWIKLVQAGTVQQVVSANPDTGDYELLNVVAGTYDVIVDDNDDNADFTAAAPVNWLFGNPATGLLSVTVVDGDVTDQDFGLTFDFDLGADCACGYEDGLLTQRTITIDGDMSDWGPVFSDGDNNACDATDDTDLDHPVQSTGRNLLRTAVTWDATYFSMWTQRVGSSNNTQNLIYYADTNADGIQQNGEPVVVAKWQGNTGNVTLELYTYDDLGSGGDPVLDANGFADGYSMPGDLTFVKTLTMPDGAGQGSTTGNTDGTQMEWTVEWTELGVPAGSAIGWHVGSTNSNPGAAGLGAQIDDNLGGCGGQCTGSNQFGGIVPTPIGGGAGETVYAAHIFTNTGNGTDLFDFTWTWTGDFAPASVTFYRDLGTVGEFDPGVDELLTDTDADTDPDTGNLASGESFELLIAIELPGAGASGDATVTTMATSNFVPGCGGTVTPVSGSVDDPVKIVPKIVKRAFQSDGTPIASGSTLPSGMPVKFLIYIANYGGALTDVSLRDVLDSVFAYQAGSMQVDNTLVASVVCPAGVCDEAAIFSQVDGSGTAVGDGDSVTAPVDADEASYDGGTRTVELGDQSNSNNAQLNIGADSVWSLVFTSRMQ